jgi:hypothetical protein
MRNDNVKLNNNKYYKDKIQMETEQKRRNNNDADGYNLGPDIY